MINSPAAKRSGFYIWIKETTSKLPLVYFRVAFAAIWLTYDLVDVTLGQTAKLLWFYRAPEQINAVFFFQIILIICEVALLFGWRSRYFAFCAFLARGAISYVAPLNDFYYFSVIALLLSQCDTSEDQVPAWPRDLLVLQTAWIYFATGFLKLNPPFLSGSDLYVRQNYEALILPIPFPQVYKMAINHLAVDATLAWMAAIIEIAMSVLLVLWLLSKKHWPQYRRPFRLAAVVLSVGVHAYALCFLNVFFFSASMIAQVFFLTMESERTSDQRPV